MLIVYHDDCIDGAAAAWVRSRALHGGTAAYLPYTHDDHAASEQRLRQMMAGESAVCFVDVTPEPALLKSLLAEGKTVEIIDHHISVAAQLRGLSHPNLHIVFDPAAPSAAKLAWSHFFPQKEAPAVIEMVDRMDGAGTGLKTPDDFAAAAYIDTFNIHTSAQALKTLKGLAKLNFNAMAKKGQDAAAMNEAALEKLLQTAGTVRLQLLPGAEPLDVPIVHGTLKSCGRGASRRLAALGTKSGAGAAFIWTENETGAVSLSIRTDDSLDASKVAEHLRATMGVTGGGHKDAAAVHFASLGEFQKWIQIKPAGLKPPEPPSPA